MSELPKIPWTTIYLTCLELDDANDILQENNSKTRILYAIFYGPNGLKTKDSSDVEMTINEDEQIMNSYPLEVQCPEALIRKEEGLMELDSVINDFKEKLCI